MSGGWYFRSNGIESGPVKFIELQVMARQGRLVRIAEVRQGKDGLWQLAAVVADLFPTLHAPAVVAAKEAARTIECGPDNHAVPAESLLSSSPERTANDTARRPAPHPINPVPAKNSETRSARIRYVGHNRNRDSSGNGSSQKQIKRYRLPAIVAVIAALNLAVWLWPIRNVDRERYERFQAIYNELLDHRILATPDPDWKQWAHAGRMVVNPIAEDLKETANVREPAKIHLLNIARDYLPEMLKYQSAQPTPAEEQFVLHMQEVRSILRIPQELETTNTK